VHPISSGSTLQTAVNNAQTAPVSSAFGGGRGPQGGMVRSPRSWQVSSQSSQGGGWQGGSQGGQGGGWQSGSGTPSQATQTAFSEALEQAAALGVITSGQAGQYESAANTATDAQLQQLTAQLNELVASTPSAAATIAPSTSVPATTTSWWSGSTTLFGATISNPMLAIGAGLIAVIGYAALKKK
jgi:hypothetical protein